MDGDLRYAAIREHITTQHEAARLERSACAARPRHARSVQSSWSSGVAAVVGTTRRRLSRKPATA